MKNQIPNKNNKLKNHHPARTATAPHQQLTEISTKILVSLLRHTDLIPADKVGLLLPVQYI